MDTGKIDNVELDGVDMKDYPEFADAFIVSADYDGVPMTEEQLEEINEDYEFLYKQIVNHLT